MLMPKNVIYEVPVPDDAVAKKSVSLDVSVPRATCFHLPEGCYRATIRDLNTKFVEKASGTGEVIKFLFEVHIPGMEKTLNLATAEYRLDMSTGSELRNLVTRLLSSEEVAEAAGGTINLGKLVGTCVVVEVEHIITNKRDQYTFPLVKVRDVRLARTAQPTLTKEADTKK